MLGIIDKTKEVIAGMLKENTGSSMLDSGSAYGRHWERNQVREFDDEPIYSLQIKTWKNNSTDICFTHNVYHWLSECLEYDEAGDKYFHDWCKQIDPDNNNYWMELIKMFLEHLKEEDIEIGGLYNNGDHFNVNTYNHESLLSQTIQYEYFTIKNCSKIEDGVYVLLQIHNGCDVRGGYTIPRLFRIDNCDEAAILGDQRATIHCNAGCNWDTDDGYHWYEDGSTAGKQLQEYIAEEVNEDTSDVIKKILKKSKRSKSDITQLGNKIWIDEGIAHCPICGAIFE